MCIVVYSIYKDHIVCYFFSSMDQVLDDISFPFQESGHRVVQLQYYYTNNRLPFAERSLVNVGHKNIVERFMSCNFSRIKIF